MVIESAPQVKFPIFILIVYVPTVVKFKFKTVEPVSHVVGSMRPKSLPNAPPAMVHPVEGVTVQTNLPGTQVPLSILFASPLVFVKVVGLFTHTVSFGETVNDATGLCETYIGTTVAVEDAQGFEAWMVPENEFG